MVRMAEKMTSYERVMAAMRVEEPDRVPIGAFATAIGARAAGISLRRYATEGKAMAEGQMALHEKYGLDYLFPLSEVGMVAEGWGCKIKYVDEIDVPPMIEDYAIKDPLQWKEIRVLDPMRDGRMPVMVEAIERLSSKYGDEVAIPGIIFSPMTTATHIRSLMKTMVDVKRSPDLLRKGLETITTTLIREAEAFQKAGANMMFIALTRAAQELVTRQQYEDIALKYDERLLSSVRVPVMVHACQREPFIDMILEKLPNISAINWWDKGAIHSLSTIKEKYGRKFCVAAGMDQTRTMIMGTPQDVEREAKTSIEIGALGGGFILASGCEVPATTPPENMKMLRQAAEKYGTYPLPQRHNGGG